MSLATNERGAFSVPEFCQWASISKAWAWQLIADGRLASVKRGRRRLILIEDARAWLRSGCSEQAIQRDEALP